MLATVMIVVAVAVATILVYAATKPDMFVVRRSVLIHAAPHEIFPLIDDLRAQSA
jgi:hypothetical protein